MSLDFLTYRMEILQSLPGSSTKAQVFNSVLNEINSLNVIHMRYI